MSEQNPYEPPTTNPAVENKPLVGERTQFVPVVIIVVCVLGGSISGILLAPVCVSEFDPEGRRTGSVVGASIFAIVAFVALAVIKRIIRLQ